MARKKAFSVVTGKSAKFYGVTQMKDALTTLALALGPDGAPKYRERLKDVLLPPGEMLMEMARHMAPVRTGNLRDSIYVRRNAPDKDGVDVFVSRKQAFYASMVESRHPYFRPAVKAMRPQLVGVIQHDMKAMLRELANEFGFAVDA
jgi:hypothetical protein